MHVPCSVDNKEIFLIIWHWPFFCQFDFFLNKLRARHPIFHSSQYFINISCWLCKCMLHRTLYFSSTTSTFRFYAPIQEIQAISLVFWMFIQYSCVWKWLVAHRSALGHRTSLKIALVWVCISCDIVIPRPSYIGFRSIWAIAATRPQCGLETNHWLTSQAVSSQCFPSPESLC